MTLLPVAGLVPPSFALLGVPELGMPEALLLIDQSDLPAALPNASGGRSPWSIDWKASAKTL